MMTTWRKGTMILFLAKSFFLGVALAQSPTPSPPTGEPIPAPKVSIPDPTVPSPKMKEFLTLPKAMPGAQAAPKLPALALRGRIISKSGPALAHLEVDGRSMTVSAGTTIMIGNGVSVKVKSITATEVRLEIPAIGETVIVN